MIREDLHGYQKRSVSFIKDIKKCGLFLDMGLGKTVSTLTAISDLLDDMAVTKVLIVAPLRVANTVWKQEAEKWEHLNHLRINICTGSPNKRLLSLQATCDICVINRENIMWMVKKSGFNFDFDMIVIDESSSFKSIRTQRFRALRTVIKHTSYRVLLSGTPSPNSYMDLWSQIFILDQGERLSRTITGFRQRFFTVNPYITTHNSWELKRGAEESIKKLIGDVALSMSAEDYLELPPKIIVNHHIELDTKSNQKYKDLEKDFIVALEDTDVEVLNAAALANKLLQVCNGSIYDSDKKAHTIHKLKIEALKAIVEDNPNENILVAYNFISDLTNIKAAFPEAKQIDKHGVEIDNWNKGKIRMLLAHPQSAGHGLNLQAGGNIVVWFGLNWSLELYQQFNARLHRQGQTKPVTIAHIIAKGCIDERVVEALNTKAKTQKDLLDYLKENIIYK